MQQDSKTDNHAVGEHSGASASSSTSARSRVRKRLAWGAGLLLVALASVATWWLTRPIPPLVTRLTLPEGQELSGGVPFAIAPDGRTLVYSAEPLEGGNPRLYRRALGERRTTPLEGTEGALNPFFSPDGEWVGFFANDGLYKVAVGGGPPSLLCDAPGPASASWYADDWIVFASRVGLQRVSSSGGSAERFVTGDAFHFYPDVMPDGRVILYTSADRTIRAYVPETGEHRILTNGARALHLPTGRLLIARESTLWAVRFDPESLEILSEPVRVHQGVRYVHEGEPQFQVSDQGALAYVHESVEETSSELVILDRKGGEQPFAEAARRHYRDPRLSPDEGRLAVESGSDIWIVDAARGTSTRLTQEGEGSNVHPIWSPDGRRILFASNRGGGAYQLFSKDADGSEKAIQLTKGAHRVPTSITSDGKTLIFREVGEGSHDIGALELGTEGPSERMLLDSSSNEHTGMLSPDDRWLAYVSDGSGREEVYVTSFPEPGDPTQISTDGGTEPVWSRDGRELFYRRGEALMAVVMGTAGRKLTPGKTKRLFDRPYDSGVGAIGSPGASYDVTSDGRFVVVRIAETPATRIHFVLNWFQQLGQR